MILQQNSGESLFLPDLRSRFSEGVIGANNRNYLKAWFGSRVAKEPGKVFAAVPSGSISHWGKRATLVFPRGKTGKSRKSCRGKKNMLVMSHLLRTNFCVIQAKQSWFLLWILNKEFERKWRWIDWGIFIEMRVTLIFPFTISNVFWSSLMRSIWELTRR